MTDGNRHYAVITPFKVIQGHRVRTNRKLIYDFLLVIINTNLPPILHGFRDIAFLPLLRLTPPPWRGSLRRYP